MRLVSLILKFKVSLKVCEIVGNSPLAKSAIADSQMTPNTCYGGKIPGMQRPGGVILNQSGMLHIFASNCTNIFNDGIHCTHSHNPVQSAIDSINFNQTGHTTITIVSPLDVNSISILRVNDLHISALSAHTRFGSIVVENSSGIILENLHALESLVLKSSIGVSLLSVVDHGNSYSITSEGNSMNEILVDGREHRNKVTWFIRNPRLSAVSRSTEDECAVFSRANVPVYGHGRTVRFGSKGQLEMAPCLTRKIETDQLLSLSGVTHSGIETYTGQTVRVIKLNTGQNAAVSSFLIVRAVEDIDIIGDLVADGILEFIAGDQINIDEAAAITVGGNRKSRSASVYFSAKSVKINGRVMVCAVPLSVQGFDAHVIASDRKKLVVLSRQIVIAGEQIILGRNAMLDTTGYTAGEIYIGGAVGGGATDTVKVVVHPTALFLNDAMGVSNGGVSVFWAHGTLRFSGQVHTRGGLLAGNGGFVEISGLEELEYNGFVDVQAFGPGQDGALLLDPTTISIGSATTDDTDLNDNTIISSDNSGSAMAISAAKIITQLQTSSVSIAAADTITISAAISSSHANSNTLTIAAGNNLVVNTAISIQGDVMLTVSHLVLG